MSETGYDETPETTARLIGDFAAERLRQSSSAAAAARRRRTSAPSPQAVQELPPREVPSRLAPPLTADGSADPAQAPRRHPLARA